MQPSNKRESRLRFLPRERRRRARYIRFLQGAVACLPARQRQAAQLCLLEGYTLRQAAQQLGISVSAVSRRLRAATVQLQQLATLFQSLEEEREP